MATHRISWGFYQMTFTWDNNNSYCLLKAQTYCVYFITIYVYKLTFYQMPAILLYLIYIVYYVYRLMRRHAIETRRRGMENIRCRFSHIYEHKYGVSMWNHIACLPTIIRRRIYWKRSTLWQIFIMTYHIECASLHLWVHGKNICYFALRTNSFRINLSVHIWSGIKSHNVSRWKFTCSRISPFEYTDVFGYSPWPTGRVFFLPIFSSSDS